MGQLQPMRLVGTKPSMVLLLHCGRWKVDFQCARGLWGQKSQGRLQGAQELEGRLEAEAILLCRLLSTTCKAWAHSQPSASHTTLLGFPRASSWTGDPEVPRHLRGLVNNYYASLPSSRCVCPLLWSVQRPRICVPQSFCKQLLYFTSLHLTRKSEGKEN